jgi:hypothetical protein
MKRQALYILLALLGFTTLRAQVNLVPNGDFEIFNVCPYNQGALQNVPNWNISLYVNNDPDYFNICHFSPTNPELCGVPFNTGGGGGFQYPQSVDGYVGLDLIKQNNFLYREFIQVQLAKPLDTNQFYCYTMYLSLSDSSERATDDFGVLFRNAPLNLNTTDTFPEPQIVNYGTFLTDKVNWMKYEGIFKAVGGEEYMSIGCFSNYDELKIEVLGSNFNLNAYYYIDNISLYECDSLVEVNEIPYNTVSIYPNPAKDFVSIDIPENINQAQLSIYNLTGQLISQKQITQFNQQIPILELDNGIYIFVIQNKDKVIGRQRVVISE